MGERPSLNAKKVSHVVKSEHFVDTEVSFAHSQVPTRNPFLHRKDPINTHPLSLPYIFISLFYIRFYPPSELFPEYFPTKTVYAYTVRSTLYVPQTLSLFLKYVHQFVHIPLPHTLNVMLTCYFSLNATNRSHPLTTICSSLAHSVNPLTF
jgi:hypothetical protein